MADSIFFTDQEKAAQYDWAEHLIWMEGGEIVEPAKPTSLWPGLFLAVVVAVIAYAAGALGKNSGGFARFVDPVLVAMLLGLIFGNVKAAKSLLPGLNLSVRKLLPLGIVFLGARISFSDALSIGVSGLLLSVLVVSLSLGLIYGLRKWLGLERVFSCLLAVGTGICGGTAIVAVAPILKAKERDVMLGVALVTLVGFAAMLILPVVAAPLGLSQTQFGMLAGLTIHQTPQVIASGFAYGEEAGEVATIAKLARVCLLAPVALVLGWLMMRKSSATESERRWYSLFPPFAIGFLIFAAARSLGLLPETSWNWSDLTFVGAVSTNFDLVSICNSISGFLLTMGMVGVGFQTRFSQFRSIGYKPVVAAVGGSLVIGCVVLMLVTFLFP